MRRPVLWVAALLLALGGCTGGGGTVPTSTTGATASTVTATAEATPVDLDEVRQALGRTVESTGRITERVEYAFERGTSTTTTVTTFDGTSGNREVVRTVDATSDEAFRAANGGATTSQDAAEAEVRYVDGVLYVKRRERWLRYTSQDTRDAMDELGLALDGDSSHPAALLAMVDAAERTALRSERVDGSIGYRLTVPAAAAAGVLNLRALTDSGHDASDLGGTADLDVVVGRDGTITSATLDATALFGRFVTLVAGTDPEAGTTVTATLTVDGLGDPFTVEAPPEDEVDDA